MLSSTGLDKESHRGELGFVMQYLKRKCVVRKWWSER